MHLLGRAIALAAAACGAAPATAQTYPARSIEMIVPFLAGGMTDAVAHAMQNELSKVLGQTVSIVNKGGASGTVGIIDLFRAPPDGYTIAITSNSPLTVQPHVQKVPYTLDSFRYICVAYYTPLVLIAGPRAPFQTFEEFVRFARAKAGNLVYTYPGIASQQHVAMLALLNAIGASAVGVSTSGGMDTVRALFEDAAMAIIDTPAVGAGTDFPVLAALSEERIGTLPDVRTMKELGYPTTSMLVGGLIAPASVPALAADTLERACAAAMMSAESKAAGARLKVETRYLPGEAFRKIFEADSAKNAEIIARAGLTAGK